MGKVIKTVVGIGIAVFGALTWQPWIIAAGLGIALSDMLVPEVPDAGGNEATTGRLGRGVEPEARRKIVFGNTLAGMDQRFWEQHTSDTKLFEVLAHATHEIEGYGDFFIDGEAVTFSGNDATGKYAGSLTKRNVTVGVTGVAGGTGTRWTSTSKFTGCAYSTYEWTYDQEALPKGIPSKIKQEVQGALVYDPRKDTTVGGSGAHRADDQTTWEYSPVDSNGVPIGRNNALQMLWYHIGWKINGTLVCGMGIDLDDIDYAAYIAAANNCETQEWYSDVLLDTGDGHKKNRQIIAAAAGGVVLDTGGVFSYRVAIDDTAVIAQTFTLDDIISEISQVPKKLMSQRFNEVAGTWIDPDTGYQKRPFPLAFDAAYYTEDGFRRRKSLSLDAVQDGEQAQRLALLYLNKGRMQGEYAATFNHKAMKLTNFDNITITFADWGWVDKLFRVTSVSVDVAGGVMLRFRDEDASVYASGTVVPVVSPAASGVGNPHEAYAVAGLSGSPQTFTGSGGTATDGLRITFTAPSPHVRTTELRIKKTVESTWRSLPALSVDNNTLDVEVALSGTAYDIEARHVSTTGVKGAWAPTTATTTSNAVVPAAVSATDPTLNRRVEWLTARGFNGIRDPLFTLGAGGWAKDNAAVISYIQDDESTGERSLRIDVLSTGTDVVNLTYDQFQPASEGERIEFSAEFLDDPDASCVVRAYMDWYDSTSTQLTGGSASSEFGSGLTADNTQQGDFVTAPALAVTGQLRIEMTFTGTAGDDLAVLMRKPMWIVATASQTVLTEFQDSRAEEIAEIKQVQLVAANEASSRQVVEVGTADTYAAITTEAIARADADTAEAALRVALEGRVSVTESDIALRATIVTTDQIVIDQNAARAAQYTTLTTEYVAADTLLQTDIDTRATITQMNTVASDAASANATLSTTLTAAYEAADTALATDISTNTAAITSEASARATADTAIALSVTNLTTTVGTNTSSISTNASAISTLDGATVQYSQILAATGSNNAIYEMVAGNGGSRINMAADVLAFRNYNDTGTPTNVMEMVSGNVRIINNLLVDKDIFLTPTGSLTQTFGTSGAMTVGFLGAAKHGFELLDADGNQVFRVDEDGATVEWGPIAGTTGAPATGATVGGTWGTDIGNRPTELTDGRIGLGLTAAGDLARNITSARRISSGILGHAAGGTYTGSLDANNVTNTNQLTDGANLGTTAVYASVTGTPTSLSDVNSGEGTKLSGIATGATANTGALADLDTVDTAQIVADAITATEIEDDAVGDAAVVTGRGLMRSAAAIPTVSGDAHFHMDTRTDTGWLVGAHPGTKMVRINDELQSGPTGTTLDIATNAGSNSAITVVRKVKFERARKTDLVFMQDIITGNSAFREFEGDIATVDTLDVNWYIYVAIADISVGSALPAQSGSNLLTREEGPVTTQIHTNPISPFNIKVNGLSPQGNFVLGGTNSFDDRVIDMTGLFDDSTNDFYVFLCAEVVYNGTDGTVYFSTDCFIDVVIDP